MMKRIIVFMIITVLPICLLADKQLPVQRSEQEQNNWCWAGSTRAIINRHGTWVEQCAIVNWLFGRTDCCTKPSSSACNQGASSSGADEHAVLEHWGIDSTRRNRSLTKSEIDTEISAGRPFYFRWEWDGGNSGHGLVGVGETGNGDGVYYIDPWLGSSGGFHWGLRSWMVDGDNHEWDHSIETNNNPPDDVRLRHTFMDDDWDYRASGDITAEDFDITDGDTTFKGDAIYLREGFRARSGSYFRAYLN
ncbi:MAG: hypothetical protein GY854_08955 [Deltaproteobacteria bacterium]|nr:hypothetical protein [Deltaproteobacteria bacterium]